MEEKKIIQKWEKSLPLRNPAPSVLSLIRSSFKNDKGSETHETVTEFVTKNFDSLLGILSAPPFSKKNVFTVEDIINSITSKILRNFQIIFWLQEWKSKKISDRIDYELWQKKNFISAFFAEELRNLLGLDNNDDLFLQAYLNRISFPVISRTESKIFNRFYQINPLKQLEYSIQKEILGNTIGELNIFLLKKWGFPEEFLSPLLGQNSEEFSKGNNQSVNSKIIYFSTLAAEFILGKQKHLKYIQFEIIYKELFDKSPFDLQKLIVRIMQTLSKQSICFGYQEIADLTIIGLLKDHLNQFSKELLSYEDLLGDAIKANKHISNQEKEIELLRSQIKKGDVRDAITGLFNHTYLQEYIAQKIREAVRYEYPITLILMDLDNFQDFNKTHGYIAGNFILKQIADLIKNNIRRSDFIARYGNDELAIILPYTGLPQSRFVAEKVFQLISNTTFQDPESTKSFKQTVSLGYASILPDQSHMKDSKLLPLALDALTKSKVKGGNRVEQAVG